MREVKSEVDNGEDKFSQAEGNGNRGEQIGSLFKAEPEGPETILVGNGGVRGLYIHVKMGRWGQGN